MVTWIADVKTLPMQLRYDAMRAARTVGARAPAAIARIEQIRVVDLAPTNGS